MENIRFRRPTGMTAFFVVMGGQFISYIGTGMTRFALTIFAWEKTGQATTLALMAFFGFLPVILFSPIGGALVDRWDKKYAMMISDLTAGLVTVVLFLLASAGQLEMWHLYVGSFIAGMGETFQWPAYSSAISVMVDKEQYARTSAIQGVVESLSFILAPILAATFYAVIQLRGILLVDMVTFFIAILSLMMIFIPPVPPHKEEAGQNSLLQDSIFGFRFIYNRPSLLGLQLVFFFANLFTSISHPLLAPMILARTASDATSLAVVNSAMGVGGVLGGIFLAWWGGPKRKIYGVLGIWIVSALLGDIGMGLARTVTMWVIFGFLFSFVLPIINASNQAIWMAKVPPALQGRVFSIRRMIAQITAPIAIFIAGPLADQLFEPAMRPDGAWVNLFGGIVGVGPGSGIALIYILAGILTLTTTLIAYSVPAVRNVETIIPDFVDETKVANEAV